MEAVLKTSVYKFMNGGRVVGKRSEKNHKIIRILEKRVYQYRSLREKIMLQKYMKSGFAHHDR